MSNALGANPGQQNRLSLFELKDELCFPGETGIVLPDFGCYITSSEANFSSLLSTGYRDDEPYRALQGLKRLLQSGESINFEFTGSSYKEAAFILSCLGFEPGELEGERGFRAQKRLPICNSFTYPAPVTVKEVESAAELEAFYLFMERIYESNFQRELNYRREVDELFENHSEFIIAYESGNLARVYGGARTTWHLPGRLLPLQLAEQKGCREHYTLKTSGDIRHLEALSIYDFNLPLRLRPLVLYELLKVMMQLIKIKKGGYDIELWSTYEEQSPEVFKLYQSKLGCERVRERGREVVLTYGDLGLNWPLIKIAKERMSYGINNLERIGSGKDWKGLGL